ncbi:MAG: HIT family protein [Clostridia bacterium]|nr:HIT family protein [Clostridia bacterium]
MDEALLKLSPGELIDRGICPTCLNREANGAIYGDESETLVYKDEDIECFFVKNPRARGHMCISSYKHYQDMSEAPDELNQKIIRFAKALMQIIKEVFSCERVYMCTMCDGPCNHYHIQLIPRYSHEKRGSINFVKPRQEYIYEKELFQKVKNRICKFGEK